jgi:hypothetical protein
MLTTRRAVAHADDLVRPALFHDDETVCAFELAHGLLHRFSSVALL